MNSGWATDSDDVMASDSDYYSTNEEEKQIRVDAANVDQLQATFNFGTSTNTAPSHMANRSPESTVS